MKPLNQNIQSLYADANQYKVEFDGTYLFVYELGRNGKEELKPVDTLELHAGTEDRPIIYVYFYDNHDRIEFFVNEVTVEAQDFYFENHGSWHTSKLFFKRSGHRYNVHNVKQISIALVDDDMGQYNIKMHS